MAWLATLPTAHITSVTIYYDERIPDSDPDGKQVQKHEVTVKEYRGLDYNTAYTSIAPATYSNGTLSIQVNAIDGGGYTLVTTLDMTIGPWITVKYTVS